MYIYIFARGAPTKMDTGWMVLLAAVQVCMHVYVCVCLCVYMCVYMCIYMYIYI